MTAAPASTPAAAPDRIPAGEEDGAEEPRSLAELIDHLAVERFAALARFGFNLHLKHSQDPASDSRPPVSGSVGHNGTPATEETTALAAARPDTDLQLDLSRGSFAGREGEDATASTPSSTLSWERE